MAIQIVLNDDYKATTGLYSGLNVIDLIPACPYKEPLIFPEVFDIAVYDPPFNIWNTIDLIIPAHTIICFNNSKHRRYAEALLGYPKCELMWCFKDGQYNGMNRPLICHETISIYGRLPNRANVGDEKVIKEKKFIRTRKKGNHSIPERRYETQKRKHLTTVLEYSKIMFKKEHGLFGKPLELAIVLLEWLLPHGKENYVWDGFAGRGTFGVAAKHFGANYIGFEKERERAARANKRIAEYIVEDDEY